MELTSWHNNKRNEGHSKQNVLESPLNHTLHPSSWTNCLPWNQSLRPKRLGTTALTPVNGPLESPLEDCTPTGYGVKRVLRASGASKESACQCTRHRRHGFHPWVGKTPWRRKWQPSPVFLTGKSHGRRSLVGYSPRGDKEADTTQHAHVRSVDSRNWTMGQPEKWTEGHLDQTNAFLVWRGRPGSNPKHPFIQIFHYRKENTGQQREREKLQSYGQLPAEINLDFKFPVSFCPWYPFICHNWEDNSAVLTNQIWTALFRMLPAGLLISRVKKN